MEKIVRTILDLISIPSVSGNEAEISKALSYVQDFFSEDNANIHCFEYDEASPVLLVSNSQSDDFDLLMVGHLDVVPAKEEQFFPQVTEDRIYGRGSNDMKSQIAIAMYVLRDVIREKTPLKVGLLITTDEETTSNGIKAFKKNEKITSKIVLDIDAGSLKTIIEKYKHSVGVKLYGHGKSGHSSRPWQSENAINNLLKVILELQKTFPEYSEKLPQPKETWLDTMVVTYITSKQTSNVVPDFVEANLNFRLTEKTSLEELEKLLAEVCEKNNTTYKIDMASCGCYMDANSPEIQNYKKIAEKIAGDKISITHMNGATDARMFADNSVIIMHSTTGANVHGDGEYVETDSIFKLYEIQKAYIQKLVEEK
ncbi:MAG: M20 family metallopeptidase [Alphaproteobacteria bacterium]